MTYHVRARELSGGSKLWLGGAFKAIATRAVGPALGLNVDTGKVAWKYDTLQPLIGGALAHRRRSVFFGRSNGFFKALERDDRSLLWQ